jgi:hypothetical protein
VALQGAVTAWGLKDTSSRPAKDLGGTLRRTSKTTLRSYDSRASGDQKCPHRQGAWQIWRIEIKLQYSSRTDL